LLTLLSCVHNVTIDRAVGAPGHGKDIVDGLNAADKRYLIMKMQMIGLPGAGAEGSEENDGSSSRMSAELMVEGTSKSLAVECARLCSDKARSSGVKSEGKYCKRKSEAKMKQRHYHVQDISDISFSEILMKLTGFPASKMTRSRLRSMYNIRANLNLGMGKIALRRIPCTCHACAEQIRAPWLVNTKLRDQPRYQSSVNCHWWPSFDGLNDWTVASLVPGKKGKDNDSDDIFEAQNLFLDAMARQAQSDIVVGGVGAFATADPGWLLSCRMGRRTKDS
jgi:hypothetical protein